MINSWVPAATDSTLCPHRLAAVLEDSEPVSPQAAEGPPSWVCSRQEPTQELCRIRPVETIKRSAALGLPRSACLRCAAAASRGRARTTRPNASLRASTREAEHLLHDSPKRRQPRPSSQLYGIRVPQAVHQSEVARRPRVVVALHSDHCRRRPDLGYPREGAWTRWPLWHAASRSP